ncbi:MAG: hypothetical protein RLZZ225_460, partial [Pseudomonadota bacterium]
MNLSYPFKLISGKGLGVSYSSYTQIGAALPSRDLGLLKIQSFVNVNTGNLILCDHKAALVEKNFPLELYYVYNSHAETVAGIWRLAHKYLKTVPASATAPLAILVEADGHETPYHRDDKTGRWLAPFWSDSRPYLSYDAASKHWKWFDPKTQISEIYDEGGHLIQRLDSENRATEYYYDQMETPWQLERIRTPGCSYEIRRQERGDGSYIESFYRIFLDESSLLQFSQFDKAARLIKTTIALADHDKSKWPYVKYHYRADAEGGGGVYALAYLASLEQSDGTYFYFHYREPSDYTAKPIEQFVCQRSMSADYIVLADFTYAGRTTSIKDFAKVAAKLYFNEQGSITQIDREKGYALHPQNSMDSCYYTYHENNQLASMTSAGQGQQSFEYDATDGQLIKQQKANGQITEYYYDQTSTRRNRITQVIKYSDATAQVTRKVYDQTYGRSAQGLYLRFEISPEGRVREYHDGDREAIQCTILHLAGRFPVERYAKDKVPSLAEMTSWVSQQNLQQRCLSECYYDNSGQPRRTYRYANIDDKGQGISDDSMSQLITHYTIFGDLYFHSETREKDAPKLQTLREFDNLRRLLSSQNAADEKTSYLYVDRRVEMTQPNGRREVTELDIRGWITKEQQTIQVNNAQAITREATYSRNVAGCATEQCTHADGQISYRFYDTQGRLGFTVHPSGALTEYRFDAQNRYKTTIAYAKCIDKEKLIAGRSPGHLPAADNLLDLMKAMSIADPLHDRTIYDFYNTSECLIYQVDEESYITQRVYNHHDQVIAQVQHQARLQPEQLAELRQGKDIFLSIDPNRDRIQRSFYDADQQLIGLQDAAGYVTEYKRNGANWVTEVIRYAQCRAIDIYAYDFDQIRPPTYRGYDAHEYHFYDARGWLVLSVDAEGYITTKDYLLNGVVSREKRYANPVDVAFYNNTRVVPPLPAESAEDQTISYVYDALNREIESRRSDGKVTFTHYNNMGEIIARGVRDALTAEISGDSYRANECRIDGWGQTTAEASAQNSALLAQIDADSTLKPEQKQRQKEALWQQQTRRHVYAASGLKISSAQRSSPEAKDQISYYYYNIERHLLLTIQVIAEKQVQIREYSRDTFNRIIKTRDYSQVKATLADKFNEPLTGGFLSLSLRKALDALQDDAQDVITSKAYNKRSEVIQRIDAEGYATQYMPNAFAEIAQTSLPVHNKQASLLIQHQYEPRGLEIMTQRQAENASIKIKRDYSNLYGKLTHIRDELGGNYQHIYDRKARLIWTQNPLHQRPSRIAYDAWDRTSQVSNALGQTTRYLYNQSKRQQIIIDPRGNRRSIIQNVFSEKIAETDAHQQTQTWQHSYDGKISRYRDALGRGYVAVYNLRGDLIERQILAGIKTRYVYDALGNRLEKIEDVESSQRKTQYQYNLLGRCIKSIDPRGIIREKIYDRRGDVIKQYLDPNQATQSGLALQTTCDYNGQRKLIREAIGDAQAADHYVRVLDYDGLNRHCATTIDPVTATRQDALDIRTQQHKNGRDMTLAAIDANGQLTRFIIDSAGRRCFQINALAGVTEWKYNDADQLVLQREYQLALAEKDRAQLNDQTTPEQLRAMLKPHVEDGLTYHYYDANGNQRFTLRCYGKLATVNEQRYDALQREVQTIQYATAIDVQSPEKLSTAQLANQLIKIADPAQDRIHYFLRDEVGQLRFSIGPMNDIHEQRFDAEGRLISQIDYANAVTDPAQLAKLPISEVIAHINSDESQDRYQLFFFDSLGQALYSVNPEGQIIRYQQDANGNLTEEVHFNQRVAVPQQYAALRAQLNALTPDPAQDRITQKTYDAANRLIQKTDALTYVESYQYDAVDNRISYSDRQQSVWKTIFDSAKRAIVEITPTIPMTQVSQEASGLLQATNLDVAIEKHKVYDKVGNVCRIITAANTAEPRVFEAEYNALNQWQATHLPEIAVDDAGALKPEDWRYRPEKKQTLSCYRISNAKGLKVAEQDHAGHWKFWVYDEQKRPLYEVSALGFTSKKEYDAFGQMRRHIRNATPCTLDLSVYRKTGIPKAVLEDYYRTRHSDADQIIDYQYDQRGRVISQRQGPVYCYTPRDLHAKSAIQFTENISQQKADIKKSYNAFGQRIYQSEKIDAIRSKASFYWFDRHGQCLAEVEAIGRDEQTPSYRCKRYVKDSFNQTISQHAYAKPLLASISSQWSLAKLHQALDQIASSEDRSDQFHYDQAGRLLKKVRQHAVRQTLQLTDGLPSLVDKSPQDLSVAFQYTPNGLVSAKIYEDGSIESSYYDKRGCRLAQTDVVRDNAGLSDPLQPLSYYGYNAHGQVVSTTRFKQGTKPAAADSFPQPLARDPADQQQLQLFDARGKLHWKQSAKQTLQGISYTANGKLARQWWTLSNWQQSEGNQYQQISDLDEKYFQYDAQDRTIRSEVRRNTQVVDTTWTRYDAFNQSILEGKDPENLSTYRHFDKLGRLWSSNAEGGVPTLYLHDLKGQCALRMQSARQDLSRISYLELPHLLSWDINDLERTENQRDLAGRVLTRALPANYQLDPSQAQIIPLSLLASALYPEFGPIQSLSWPTPQERNVDAEFSLWPKDFPDLKQTLPIIVQGERCGVDVSQLATDVYDYQMSYYLSQQADPNNPNPSRHLSFISSGTVQFDTGNTTNSHHLVAIGDAKQTTLVRLSGNTQDIVAVELWQDLEKRAVLDLHLDPSTHDYYVDLSGHSSGVYQLKPQKSDKSPSALSLDFTIYSDKPAHKPLSRELPAALSVRFLANHAEVNWQLPAFLKAQSVQLQCRYRDSHDQMQLQTGQISPTAKRSRYVDKKGNEIQSNVDFDQPIKAIAGLSLAVLWPSHYVTDITTPLSNHWLVLASTCAESSDEEDWEMVSHPAKQSVAEAEQDWIPLYVDVAPSASPFDAEVISELRFNPKRLLMVSPLLDLKAAKPSPVLEYLDVSQDRMRCWKQFQTVNLSTRGFSVDVSGFMAGVYPFRCGEYTGNLVIAREGQVFASPNSIEPDRQHLVQPARRYRYDLWNNRLSETDSLGHTSEFSYNDADQPLQTLEPWVDVVDEQGSAKTLRPMTRFGYNERNIAIASQDAHGNTRGSIVDAAGHLIIELLADGTKRKTQLFDALNNLYETRDAAGQISQYWHDKENNLLAFQQPSGRRQVYAYDQLKHRISATDPAGNTRRYNFDALGNVNQRYEPQGQSTRMLYGPYRQLMAVENPDGSRLNWQRDAFGKAIQHTDLSGAVYHYQYDHKKQVIEASSQGGDHGQYLQLDRRIIPYDNTALEIDVYALTPKPVPGQQLSYQYISGRVTELADLASGKTTYYSYDTEGRRIGIRVVGKDGELLRETSAENDALGREILTRDNQAVFTTAYDAVSNRRYIKGVVNRPWGGTLQQEVWWKYDAQDRVLLAEGILADGEIKLTSDQGTEFSYQADRRISESQLDESNDKLVADLQYDIDGRLIGSNYHTATDAEIYETTEREYDLAGWQKNYKDSFPGDWIVGERVHIQHQRVCNENGWLTDDTQIIDQDKPIHTEYQDLTALGLPQRQVIHYNDESANEDHLDYHYVGWDEWRVARIEGYRSNRYGRSPYASAQHFIGPNGEPNAVIGAQDADSRKEDQHKYFQATADGLVIRRLYFEKKWFTQGYFKITKETFYFYRVNGQYLGSYVADKDGGFGLNFVRHQQQNRAGRELGISLMNGMNPGRAISFNPLGSNHALSWDQNYGQSDALANIPATYTSVTGDSYAAIAEKIYGDAGLASYIEAANGGGALIAGQTLVIPQLIVVRNKAGMALPYYQLLQIMQGSLLPHLQTPQPQEHHSFWGTLLRAIVVVVVVIFAPELVAALPAALAGMVGLSHVILTAVVAGLMDAAAQGFCVGLGLLDHFSLAETLTVMLSAGLSAQLPAGLSPAEAKSAEAIAEHMLKVGMVNVEEQFAEMAIGVRDQFDVAGVALAMGSAGLGDKIGAEMKLDNPWVQRSITDIGTAAMSGVVRGRFDIEGLATQLIADNVGVTMQQAKAKSISKDESYHQSQQASRGNGVANDLDEQWQS